MPIYWRDEEGVHKVSTTAAATFSNTDDGLETFGGNTVEEIGAEVVCLECCHRFEDDSPDECPHCGSSDLDVA